jgi:uncharacterized protein
MRLPSSVVLAALLACGSRPAPESPQPPAPETSAKPATGARPALSSEAREGPPSAPAGYVEMTAIGVFSVGAGEEQAVGLALPDRTVVVPIFIGGTEALTIMLRLYDQPFTRPLTHDLLDSVLHTTSSGVYKVQVDDLVDGVFIGSVFLERDGRIYRLDSRPSDAIAIAVGHRVPIYVANKVVDAAGISPDDGLRERPPSVRR